MGNWQTASGQQVSNEQPDGADLRAVNEHYRKRQLRRRSAQAAEPEQNNRRQMIEKQARKELLLSYLLSVPAKLAGGLAVAAVAALLFL